MGERSSTQCKNATVLSIWCASSLRFACRCIHAAVDFKLRTLEDVGAIQATRRCGRPRSISLFLGKFNKLQRGELRLPRFTPRQNRGFRPEDEGRFLLIAHGRGNQVPDMRELFAVITSAHAFV